MECEVKDISKLRRVCLLESHLKRSEPMADDRTKSPYSAFQDTVSPMDVETISHWRGQVDVKSPNREISAFSEITTGYQIEKEIGRGGTGIVFKATQIGLDRKVALKTIRCSGLRAEKYVEQFRHEAKVVANLNHPNIVTAYDFGLSKGQAYFAMELVDGMDAEQLIRECGQLSEFKAWNIIRQVCFALARAAELNIVHRDIKPSNILLGKAPLGSGLPSNVLMVKVTDFGLACFKVRESGLLWHEDDKDEWLTGTPVYMAPELIASGIADERSDIYSLGVTAWQFLTGRLPLDSHSPERIFEEKDRRKSDWLAGASNKLSRRGFQVLKKMCSHDRRARYENYNDLIAKIDQVIDFLAKQSRTETVSRLKF